MNPGREDSLFANRPLMTIRVSRDSGHTWEPERAIFSADGLAPLVTMEWPPCKCPRCAQRQVSFNG